MSEKTFKVGDRVRITSAKPGDYDGKNGCPYWVDSMNQMLGMCGTIDRVATGGKLIDVKLDGIESIWCWLNRDLELIAEDNAPQPRRLPQVGEVWRSRDGKFTVKLELNDNPSALAGGYVFIGNCSDGSLRTFTAEGMYWNDGSEAKENLVERVSEAEPPAPEPQIQSPPQLEVSVDVVTIVDVKDKVVGVAVYYDSDRDVTIDVFRSAVDTVFITKPTIDEIAALARCFAKLHEILIKEAAK